MKFEVSLSQGGEICLWSMRTAELILKAKLPHDANGVLHPPRYREFIDTLLVRIHLIIVMIRWTGLAPWEFEFLKAKLPHVANGILHPPRFPQPLCCMSPLRPFCTRKGA